MFGLQATHVGRRGSLRSQNRWLRETIRSLILDTYRYRYTDIDVNIDIDYRIMVLTISKIPSLLQII